MRRIILFASIIAIAIVSTLFSCVDSDKNFYDSSYRMPNPMGDEFVAPDGFDWSMTEKLLLSVWKLTMKMPNIILWSKY